MTTDPTSAQSWISALRQRGPHTIHAVGHSQEVVEAIEAAAWSLGMHLFRVDAADIPGEDELFTALKAEMKFPYGYDDWNSLIICMSSIDDWIPNEKGYVLLFEHAGDLRRRARRGFDTFVRILPNVSDRWQTIGPPFHVVFTGDRRLRAAVGGQVAKGNERLHEAYSVPWRQELGETYNASALLDHGEPEPS